MRSENTINDNVKTFNSLIDLDNQESDSFLGFKVLSLSVPRISVIIPSLQEEKIIEKNLSIFTEDLKKRFGFEVILSDGGSTDHTIDKAKKYVDKIVVHDQAYRQTIAEGRNRGAETALGEFLVFLNADSTPENPERFFEIITDWAAGKSEYSDSSALACYIDSFSEETLFKDKIFYMIHNKYVKILNKIGLGMGRGECQIVRKDVFLRVNGYNSDIVAGEDFDLFRRVAKIGRISFVDELRVLESPRRFRKYGYFRIVLSWILNSISVMFFGKSISKEWEAVR